MQVASSLRTSKSRWKPETAAFETIGVHNASFSGNTSVCGEARSLQVQGVETSKGGEELR